MDTFLSCDWGTSTFRLRLVNTANLTVITEEVNREGIAVIFKCWKQENGIEKERLSFYRSFLVTQIKKLEEKQGRSLQHLPVLISGMASSTLGMKELPYKELPFKTDGSDLLIDHIPPVHDFFNQLFLISGVSTGDDVLRGEETLLAGADAAVGEDTCTYIFPGTHSKHVYVNKGQATGFNTFMTGEFFELLTVHSILANSVERSEAAGAYFQKGIQEGASSNLLNSAFHVRTSSLFKKNTPGENYHYLSGLLIGHELKELESAAGPVVLVCGTQVKEQYLQGLSILGLDKKLSYVNADDALLKGQWRILQPYIKALGL
jgi:2-dehydro-3-deoxygalactonokinase